MTEREIFERALSIPDPDLRNGFLDEICGADAELRLRVNALLEAHHPRSDFLETPIVVRPRPEAGYAVQDPGHSGVDDGDTARTRPADLAFLQPSGQPGSLGVLSHYEILQELGRGAFGIVLKAFDEKLHRLVAIKVLNPQLATTSPPRKRFLREARAVAALKHENIVQVYSVEEEPLPYLVMEFVEGQTLQERLDSAGPLEPAEVLHLGRQMAAGLAAAHDKGLIHRDIKPGNILLETGPARKVKITDFGLARAVDDASLTRTGTIAGTPMYMAPEQALGQTLDHRADLFSLGSVLYQMVSGRPPFRGPTPLAVLKRVVDENPRPIQDVIPNVPDWLSRIVHKLQAKDPADRYQSAHEVDDTFARCQRALEQSAVQSGPDDSQPRPAPGAVTRPNVPLKLPHSVWWRWRKSIVVLLVAVLLLLTLHPSPRLWMAGVARFKNLTRDGVTRIDFLRHGHLAAEQTGFGELQLPAGDYELRISHPDQELRIYNAILTRRSGLFHYDNVVLSSPPAKLSLRAGERIDFMVAWTRQAGAHVAPPM